MPASWGKGADFAYPAGWDNNEALVPRGKDLAGFAQVVCAQILKGKPPAVVMCGSRGCQVTLGLVWRTCWQGPTIIINAGCLMTRTRIPPRVFPVFYTCSRDYFETKEPTICEEYFNALSDTERGVLVRVEDSHMPCSTLPTAAPLLVDIAARRASAADLRAARAWPPGTTIWGLRAHRPAEKLWP